MALCTLHVLTEQQGEAYLVQEARRPGHEDTDLVHPVGKCIECVPRVGTFHREAYGCPCPTLRQSIHILRAEASQAEAWIMRPMPVTYHFISDTRTLTSHTCYLAGGE